MVRDTLVDKAKTLRNDVYFVKRGAINWTTHDFDQDPRAVAVMIDDFQLFGKTNSGMKTANLSIEMFAKMPQRDGKPEIDDALQDELVDDAEALLRHLQTARDGGDNPVVFKLDLESARVIEAHDIEIQVQGAVVQFAITY